MKSSDEINNMLVKHLAHYRDACPNTPIVRWDALYNNTKKHAPTRDMLNGDGIAILYSCRTALDPAIRERIVIFDRDYVIAKLRSDLSKIMPDTVDDWIDLMSCVYVNRHD